MDEAYVAGRALAALGHFDRVGANESPSMTALGSVLSDALAGQSGCCRGGHNGGDRRGVFADRQRDRAAGASRRARSGPQLRLRRRPLRLAARQLHPGDARRRQRGSALQRRRVPVRAGARQSSHGRRHLLLVRDRQPGPRTGAGQRARRADHRHRRRAPPGVPGATRHHRSGVLGHRGGRPRGAELVGAVPRPDQRRPLQGRRKLLSRTLSSDL